MNIWMRILISNKNHYSRTAKGVYKIGHQSIGIMKRLLILDTLIMKIYTIMIFWQVFWLVLIKLPNGQFYLEVKDKRYISHPTENNILRKRDPPLSLRTQYQVQYNTLIKKGQKVVENTGRFEVDKYLKKKKQLISNPNLKRLIVLNVNGKIGKNSLMVIYGKLQNFNSKLTNVKIK